MNISFFPQPHIPLIGREPEQARLHTLFAQQHTRLVTLTGTVGVGKTHLALHFASALREYFNGEIVYIHLTCIRSTQELLYQIIQELRLRIPRDDSTSWQTLYAALAGRQIVIVLDPFEHLISAALQIEQLVQACPSLRLLITSQERLNVQGETVLTLQPLTIPGADEHAYDSKQYSAITFLLERIRAIQPDFQLTRENSADIAAICRRLDGLPLALELAAPYIQFLSPQMLLARLTHCLPLLVSQRDHTTPHHQSLHAAIQWSFSLLAPQEQQCYCVLALFESGCTLEVLEEIAHNCGLDNRLLHSCRQLVDKSLIMIQQTPSMPTRITMHSLLREYGLEQLERTDYAPCVRQGYNDYFLAYVQTASDRAYTEQHDTYMQDVQQEYKNIEQAFSSLSREQVEKALQLWLALEAYWTTKGDYREGLHWLEQISCREQLAPGSRRMHVLIQASRFALNLDQVEHARQLARKGLMLAQMDARPQDQAYALLQMGRVHAKRISLPEAQSLFEESLTLFQLYGTPAEQALVQVQLGKTIARLGEYELAQEILEESIHQFRLQHDPVRLADAMGHLAEVYYHQGHAPTARILNEESLRFRKKYQNQLAVASRLIFQTQIAIYERNYPEAHMLLEQSQTIFSAHGCQHGMARVLLHKGTLFMSQGNIVEARGYFQESMEILQKSRDFWQICYCLELQALVFTKTIPLYATFLLGTASMLREKMHIPLPPVYRVRYHQILDVLRSALPPQDYEYSWYKGQQTSYRQILTLSSLTLPLSSTKEQLIHYLLAHDPLVAPPMVSPSMQQTVAAEISKKAGATDQPETAMLTEELTRREQEILEFVAQGLSNKEIALRLMISARTVNAHLRSIYVKLAVNSRSSAIRSALEHHLIEL